MTDSERALNELLAAQEYIQDNDVATLTLMEQLENLSNAEVHIDKAQANLTAARYGLMAEIRQWHQ